MAYGLKYIKTGKNAQGRKTLDIHFQVIKNGKKYKG